MRRTKVLEPSHVNDTSAKITTPWTPEHVLTINGSHSIKLATLRGEFIWHSHPDTDEVFYCLSGGPFRIEMCTFATDAEDAAMTGCDETVELKPGDMFLVKRGLQHRPIADVETRVMLIEKVGTVNTGDREGDGMTSYVDEGRQS